MRMSRSRCRVAFSRKSKSTSTSVSGMNNCLCILPFDERGNLTMNETLPICSVSISTTNPLSPYLTVRSTTAFVFVVNMGVKLVQISKKSKKKAEEKNKNGNKKKKY